MAESLMLDTVKVERKVGTVDPITGQSSWQTVYSGKGKIKPPTSQSLTSESAGATEVVIPGELHTPISGAEQRAGDRVTVVAGVNNPALTGHVYRVATPHEGSLTTARRAKIEEVSP